MAANEQGVPAMCGGVVLLQFVKSLTMSRTKTNVNPPAAVPQITEADTMPALDMQQNAHFVIAITSSMQLRS
jgi:hypothetical protein